jgi:hypothetical protein
MTKRHHPWIVGFTLCSLLLTGFAMWRSSGAQAQSQYPIMNDVANKVIQKYQNSTCEQLWQQKSAHAPPTMEETRILTFLRDDANMRAAFINMVAPPIATKMFNCGMIP